MLSPPRDRNAKILLNRADARSVQMILRPEEYELFWSKIVVDCSSDCWVWIGSRHPRGYGQFANDYRKGFAHRVAYETWRGLVPKGMELDHLCRVKACANPWHVEAVTHRVNVLRGEGQAAKNAVKTHCKHGHLLDEKNTYVFTGRGYVERLCRACGQKHKAAYSAKRRRSRNNGQGHPLYCSIGKARGKCAG